jgi:hypothetical protein
MNVHLSGDFSVRQPFADATSHNRLERLRSLLSFPLIIPNPLFIIALDCPKPRAF